MSSADLLILLIPSSGVRLVLKADLRDEKTIILQYHLVTLYRLALAFKAV